MGASLNSDHTRRNFETTASRFLAALQVPLRSATVEDVRAARPHHRRACHLQRAPGRVAREVAAVLWAPARLPAFNAGAVIKVRSEARSVAQRIVTEVEISLLIRAAPTTRDRVLIEVGYAGASASPSSWACRGQTSSCARTARCNSMCSARAASGARSCCRMWWASRCCRFVATPAQMIRCSARARAAIA